MPKGLVFPYRIDFENAPTASAPAQRVVITDQLDASLDLNTFQLTGLGFGDFNLSIPATTQDYQTTVTMTENSQTFDVGINVNLNASTGLLTVTFQSIDPATQLPPSSVLTGFLPPEDGTGRGQGYVTFLIQPKAGLSTGTQIKNVALITFDANPSLATDQVDDNDPSKGVDPTKQTLVTIDAGPPSSRVDTLPARIDTPSITVTWTGSDDSGGSGIAYYDVYVSTDGGAYAPMEQRTTDTSDVFSVQAGHTYSFYSVVTDNVGNQQVAPAGGFVPVTIQVVDDTPPTATISSGPPTITGSTTATFAFGGSDDFTAASAITFQASLDNGTWASATSPLTLSGQGSGPHTLRVRATDQAGNITTSPAEYDWTIDTTPPTATFASVSPNPRSTPVSTLDLLFSEPVTGLALQDLKLTLNGVTVALKGVSLTALGNQAWQVGGLGKLTTAAGDYQLTLTAAGSGIVDQAGNALVQNATVGWHEQLFSDNFNRPNSSNLGAGWKKTVGSLSVHSNQLLVGSATGIAAVATASAADVSVQARISVARSGSQSAGLLARYGGSGDRNYYWGAVVGNKGSFTAQIWRNVNGVAKLLSSQKLKGGSGTLRFVVSGKNLQLFFNGTLVTHASDTSLKKAGLAGIRGTAKVTFDDFLADPAPLSGK